MPDYIQRDVSKLKCTLSHGHRRFFMPRRDSAEAAGGRCWASGEPVLPRPQLPPGSQPAVVPFHPEGNAEDCREPCERKPRRPDPRDRPLHYRSNAWLSCAGSGELAPEVGVDALVRLVDDRFRLIRRAEDYVQKGRTDYGHLRICAGPRMRPTSPGSIPSKSR